MGPSKRYLKELVLKVLSSNDLAWISLMSVVERLNRRLLSDDMLVSLRSAKLPLFNIEIIEAFLGKRVGR